MRTEPARPAGVGRCRATMAGQGVAAEGLAARLMDRLDSPRWIDVADRCLACANCTMVCPTCFCTSVGAVSDLDGAVNHDRATLGLLLQRRLRQGRRWQLPPAAAGPISAMAHPQVRHLARAVRHLRLRRLRALHHVVPGRHRRREELAAIAPPYEDAPPLARPPASTTSCRCPDQLAAQRPAPRRRETDTIVATVRVGSETADTSTLRSSPATGRCSRRQPGQFVMVDQPGFSPRPDLGLPRRRRAARGSPSAPPGRDPGGRPPASPARGRPARTAGRGMAARARDGPRRRHRGRRHRAGPAAAGHR